MQTTGHAPVPATQPDQQRQRAKGPEARLRDLVRQVRAMAAPCAPPPPSVQHAPHAAGEAGPRSSPDATKEEQPEKKEVKAEEKVVLGLVQNIPPQLRSLDLRLFFSDWIERKKFRLFHYLHRPEVLTSTASSAMTESSTANADASSGLSSAVTEASEAKQKIKRDTCCCVVQFYSERDLSEFKKRYHGRHWTDRKGAMLPSVCIVNKVKHEPRNQLNAEAIERQEMQQDKEKKYLTRRQRVEQARQKRRAAETQSLEDMPELHPPKALLPQGNVGTPLKWIQDRVRECAFPSSLIKELGIHDLRRRKRYRRYGEVHFDYSEQNGPGENIDEESHGQWEYTFETAETATKPAPKVNYKSHLRTSADEEEWAQESRDSEGEQDAEEWERHEALQHDDHEEYLYEQEIELQWEKGGSGLVFWTDGVYWDAQNDGKEADQFDLDTAHYYDEKGGDDDHLYGASQNQYDDDDKRYYRGNVGKKLKRKRKLLEGPAELSHFERFTRGFGSRILKRFGWEEGQGVGSTPGIPKAIELQSQMDTAGLGYQGDPSSRSKARTHAPAYGQKRRRGSDDDDEDEGDETDLTDAGIPRPQQRRVIIYPSRPRVGSHSFEEQLRRWRMNNDPSYITIGTVYDHPHTNPLLPADYYDEQEADKEDEEERARRKQEEEERYRSAALRRVFHSKPFVRGGTIEEEQESMRKEASAAPSSSSSSSLSSSSPTS